MQNSERKTFSKIGWTVQEEQELERIVKEIGNNRWTQISKKLSESFPNRVRTNKQCRERFTHYIKVKKINQAAKEWEQMELEQLLSLTSKVGTKWSVIHKQMPCWSENFLKNKFNGIVHRLLRKVSSICRSKTPHLCKEVQFKTLIRVLDFSEDENHPEKAIQAARETKSKILKEIVKVESGIEDFKSLKDLEETIHNFTLLNRAYLMAMGKKKFKPSKTSTALKEETKEQEDEGFHNVLVLNWKPSSERVQPSHKYFQLLFVAKKIKNPPKAYPTLQS